MSVLAIIATNLALLAIGIAGVARVAFVRGKREGREDAVRETALRKLRSKGEWTYKRTKVSGDVTRIVATNPDGGVFLCDVVNNTTINGRWWTADGDELPQDESARLWLRFVSDTSIKDAT